MLKKKIIWNNSASVFGSNFPFCSITQKMAKKASSAILGLLVCKEVELDCSQVILLGNSDVLLLFVWLDWEWIISFCIISGCETSCAALACLSPASPHVSDRLSWAQAKRGWWVTAAEPWDSLFCVYCQFQRETESVCVCSWNNEHMLESRGSEGLAFQPGLLQTICCP